MKSKRLAEVSRWVKEQTPLNPGYVEQRYTFGNRGRYAGQDFYFRIGEKGKIQQKGFVRF